MAENEEVSLRDTIENAAEGKYDELGIEPSIAFDDTIAKIKEDAPTEAPIENKEISTNENSSIAEESTAEATSIESEIEPPVSWKTDKKELFKTLPLEAREYIAERERERDRAFYQGRQELADIKRATQPYEDELRRNGVPISRAIEQAFAWDKYLKESPEQALMELAHRAGVDIRKLGQVVQAAEPKDPYVKQILETNAQMQQRLSEIEQERELSSFNSIKSEVSSFINRKDSQGQLMFPYAESLTDEMITLLPLVQRENPNASTQSILEDAYMRAMRANPRTWSNFQKQLEQKQKDEGLKRLQKSRNASSSVSGSGDNSQSRVAPTSTREIMEAFVAGTL